MPRNPILRSTALLLALIVVAFHVGAHRSHAQPAGSARPYDVESGVIVIRKSTRNSAVTTDAVDSVFFTDWGRVRATWSTSRTSSKFVKGETVSRTMSLIDGVVLTTVDLDKQQGTRLRNPVAGAMANMSRPDAAKMATQMAGAMNTRTTAAGEEQVAGRSCSVTESVTEMGPVKMTTRVCTWKNIVLKTSSAGAGTEVLEEAVSVNTDAPVPADRMKVPSGIRIVER